MSDQTVPWRDLLAEATHRFTQAGVAEPVISARRIVEEASGHPGSELSLHLSERASKRGVAQLDAMVARRLKGEPIQYVVGRWGFRMLDLFVDRRVLIPRPETEEVAGLAIQEALRILDDRTTVKVADLGTGSGAIGLSVAFEVPEAEVWITDVSADALSVARANLAGIGRAGSRVRAELGSWFEPLPTTLHHSFDVLVSNPPYVSPDDEIAAAVTEWEPRDALFAGSDGLQDLRTLVVGAGDWLVPKGVLVLEIGSGQGATVAEMAEAHFSEVEVRQDMGGLDRAVIARCPRAVSPPSD